MGLPSDEHLHISDRLEQAHAMLEFWSERATYLRRQKDLQEILQPTGQGFRKELCPQTQPEEADGGSRGCRHGNQSNR